MHSQTPADPPLILANAELVLRDAVVRGAVTAQAGKIIEIKEGGAVPLGAIDCEGDFVLPGLIELHTDNLERHLEPRPAVAWPTLAGIMAHDAELAGAGITTVFDALRLGSIHNNTASKPGYARNLANALLAARAGGYLKISHFLHLRAEICSATLLDEMAHFGPEDRVGIVSLMDHTPGQRQFRDMGLLKTYIGKKRKLTDEEFAEHVSRLKGLQKIYGAKHEVGALREARRYGAVLASHDDTTRAHVETSFENNVSFAEFPTTLEAAEACHEKGISVMVGAPNLVRGGSHSGNVSALELAEAYLLDMVSSDYVPGALLMSAFELARLWDDLPRAVACVSTGPAKAAGLSDRGALETGLNADLIRVKEISQTPVLKGVWHNGERVS